MDDVFGWEILHWKSLFVAGMCEVWGELVRGGQGGYHSPEASVLNLQEILGPPLKNVIKDLISPKRKSHKICMGVTTCTHTYIYIVDFPNSAWPTPHPRVVWVADNGKGELLLMVALTVKKAFLYPLLLQRSKKMDT